MNNKYRIREVEVEVRPGVILKADLQSVDGVKKLLSDLGANKLLDLQAVEEARKKGKVKVSDKEPDTTENPTARVELRAGLKGGLLAKNNVLSFKDDIPQLLRPSIFDAVSEAILVLLFSIEVGLQRQSIDYESFKALYDTQNIKSGSSLAMILNNLKSSSYIDKNLYDTKRTLSLTAKGEKKANEVLKTLAGEE